MKPALLYYVGGIMTKIEETVKNLAEPIAEPFGLEIYDVEFKKEGPDYILRVFIDRRDGYISIDDCEAVSRPLSDALDVADPIDKAYCLEVSSPGLERQLKRQEDFERFYGSKVALKLYSAVNGSKSAEGILEERNEESTVIVLENGEKLVIENDKISKANLKIEF